jgi:hypothetical protein
VVSPATRDWVIVARGLLASRKTITKTVLTRLIFDNIGPPSFGLCHLDFFLSLSRRTEPSPLEQVEKPNPHLSFILLRRPRNIPGQIKPVEK